MTWKSRASRVRGGRRRLRSFPCQDKIVRPGTNLHRAVRQRMNIKLNGLIHGQGPSAMAPKVDFLLSGLFSTRIGDGT